MLFDVSTLRFAEPYSGPVLAALARDGVDVVVSDEGMVRQLGERRRADGDETRRLVLIEGPATRDPPPGARQVALVEGLDRGEQGELDRLRPEVLDLARRDGLVLNESGVAAAAAGRIPFERTVLAPGADPAAARRRRMDLHPRRRRLSRTEPRPALLVAALQRARPSLQHRDGGALRAAAGVVGVRTPTFGAETGEVDGGADRLPGTELGSADVGPLVEGDLEHRVGADRLDGSVASGEAEEELHIERPPAAERFARAPPATRGWRERPWPRTGCRTPAVRAPGCSPWRRRGRGSGGWVSGGSDGRAGRRVNRGRRRAPGDRGRSRRAGRSRPAARRGRRRSTPRAATRRPVRTASRPAPSRPCRRWPAD